MKLFLWSLCIIIGLSTSFCTAHVTSEDEKLDYRLNTDIEPLHYSIDVTPHFGDNIIPSKEPSVFDGTCSITLKTIKSNVSSITLHKLDLDIVEKKLTFDSSVMTQFARKDENINIISSDYNNITEKFTLHLSSPLIKDELYVLHFKYTGKINKDMSGFYRGSYQDDRNVTK